ncbi:MAG: hypothetical protein ACM3YN_02350 [Parcubacteria group bacterium]
MRTLFLILGVSVALGGCSILPKDDAPVCNGKHRRPANANGSVLMPAPAKPTQLSAAPAALHGSCAA